MRSCFAASVLALLLGWPTFAQAQQQRSTPYTAYVTAADVYVRSGPGRNYYPTAKLNKGDTVEVYRHDPGGWFAIRPVEGSFTWVSGRYLQVERNGIGRITADRVAARVGSQFSDIRDVIQFRLHKGETVEILDKKEIRSSESSATWYKIAPPSGEFRWIAGKYVDPDYLTSGIRQSNSAAAGLVTQDTAANRPIEHTQPEPAEPRLLSEVLEHDAEVREPAPQAIASTSHESPVVSATHWAPVSDREVQQASATTSATPSNEVIRTADGSPLTHRSRAFPELKPKNGLAAFDGPDSAAKFQAELDNINLDLSIMLAEEPTVWEFQEFSLRTERLTTQAATAVQRGHARLLAGKIERSHDLAKRYSAVASLRAETERRNGQMARVGPTTGTTQPGASPIAGLMDQSRFDGQGRLARIVSPKLGAPQFALVDDAGKITCYVTPAPGVKLQHYVSRHIGVNGVRGHYAEQDALLVTAKHVSALR